MSYSRQFRAMRCQEAQKQAREMADNSYSGILSRPGVRVEEKIFQLRCRACHAEYTSKASNKKCPSCGTGKPERMN